MRAAIHRRYFAIWSLLFAFVVSISGQDLQQLEKADSLINLEQYEAANEIYEEWRKKYLTIPDYEAYLSTSILKADNFDISEEGDSIIGTLKEALESIDTEEVGDSILALAYHKLGTAEYQVNNNDESAILYWQKALKIREDFFPPNHLDIIRLYRNLGHGFLNLEQREKSRAHFQKAVDLHLSREEKDPVLLAKTYNALAEIYTALQDFDQAEKYLKVALNDYKILFAEEPWELYYAYENVFYFDRIKENYPKMVRSQKEILAIYELVEDRIEDDHIKIANAYSNLGLAYSLMDSLELAFQYYKKSININERYVFNKEGALAVNYNNVSNIYYRQKNYEQALKTINKAIVYDLKSGNQIGQATNLNDKATILLDLKKEDLALSTVEEAILLIKPSDNQGLILDKPLLVDLLETKLRIFKTLGEKNVQYLQRASLVIDQMTALIDQIRIEYQSDASKSLLSRKAKPIFEQAIEVYLELYNNTANQIHLRKAFQLAERSKSIILMDALQQAQAAEIIGAPETLLDREIALKRQIANKEKALFLKQGDARGLNNDLIILNRELELLSDTLRQKHPAYHQAKYVDHLSTLEEIIPLVKERGLLEYFLGDSTLYAFLLSPSSGELTIIETPLDFPLAQWVKQLRENLYRYHLSSDRSESLYQTTAAALVNSARRLYQKLIAPIASKTTLPEQLIIVPDGVLGYLPFELLIKEQAEDVALFGNHQYLLKDHQISYTYSAALLQEMQQKEHQTISGVFLAFAPAFTENPVQNKGEIADVRGGLSALLYNEPEVRAIQKRLGGAVFTGMEATKENFLQHAPNYKILHLSTHGKANDKVGDYSYLAFSPGSGDNAPDLLYNRELYSLRLNADMVVLSACETGIGELQKGEGIISLARGFAYAGAKSIVTSLWSANDRSTAEIMQLFYQNLRDVMSKDAALQQAKLAYLERQSDPLDAHPFYWATFVAVGDMAAIEWRTGTPWGFILGGALVLAAIGLWRRRKRNG